MRGLLDDPQDPIGDAVELVTSELVTNVVRHTSCGGVLRGWCPTLGEPLRLEVEDFDNEELFVELAPGPDLHAVSGRGLRIVDALADAWGVASIENGGKVVWAEFSRTRVSPGD